MPASPPPRRARSCWRRSRPRWRRCCPTRSSGPDPLPRHLLHIGKTGGTALRQVLGPLAGPLGLVLHPHPVGLADIPPGEKVAFFLRDPLARLVSGFHSRRRRGRPRYDVPWSPAEAAAFTRFPEVNDLGLGLAAGLPESAAALQGIGHVCSRLADWLVDAATLEARGDDLLFIGFQESLATDAAIFAGLLGLPGLPPLPEDAVLAHRGLPTDDRRLEPAAAAAFRRHLAADYALFEQCRALRARMEAARPGLAAAAPRHETACPSVPTRA